MIPNGKSSETFGGCGEASEVLNSPRLVFLLKSDRRGENELRDVRVLLALSWKAGLVRKDMAPGIDQLAGW